jgi:hypothetical protein
MSLAYLFDSNIQFQDKSGNNNVNGFLRVYIDNTDDRAVTYKDFNGTLNQADIRLDNNGRAVVIVDDSKTYRLEVYGTTGVLLWTLYPISPKATGINETLEALVAAVKSHTIAIEGLALGKKNKQQAKVISGTTTQTVKSLSQNADGEITVEFEDIDFPYNIQINSPDDSIEVGTPVVDQEQKKETIPISVKRPGLVKAYPEDTEPKTLIDKLEIEDTIDDDPDYQPLLEIVPTDGKVAINEDRLHETLDGLGGALDSVIETIDELDVDSVPHAYLHSTLNQSAGDSVTTGTQINVFALTADLVGNCFEFEQTTTIDDTPFGYVWIEPGTYLINASVTLQWVGNPRGTFVAKVGSVMGENFDFSQEQEIKRNTTKVVTIPNRMKLSVNITYDAGTPVMGFWIQSMQVVKLAGGMSQTNITHDSTLTGKGSVAEPLGVNNQVVAQNALAGNLAPAFDPTRTEDNKYLAGESVTYDGKVYVFKDDHYGAWAAADVEQKDVLDIIASQSLQYKIDFVGKDNVYVSYKLYGCAGKKFAFFPNVRTWDKSGVTQTNIRIFEIAETLNDGTRQNFVDIVQHSVGDVFNLSEYYFEVDENTNFITIGGRASEGVPFGGKLLDLSSVDVFNTTRYYSIPIDFSSAGREYRKYINAYTAKSTEVVSVEIDIKSYNFVAGSNDLLNIQVNNGNTRKYTNHIAYRRAETALKSTICVDNISLEADDVLSLYGSLDSLNCVVTITKKSNLDDEVHSLSTDTECVQLKELMELGGIRIAANEWFYYDSSSPAGYYNRARLNSNKALFLKAGDKICSKNWEDMMMYCGVIPLAPDSSYSPIIVVNNGWNKDDIVCPEEGWYVFVISKRDQSNWVSVFEREEFCSRVYLDKSKKSVGEKVAAILDNGKAHSYYGDVLPLRHNFFVEELADEDLTDVTTMPQGMAIFNNYLIDLFHSGKARLYNITNSFAITPLTSLFSLGSYDANNNHSNCASFGVDYYDEDDVLPVLYVTQYIAGSWKCFVERVDVVGSSTLVQTISLPSGVFGYNCDWVIDRQNKKLIVFGNTIDSSTSSNKHRVLVFNIPDLASSSVTLSVSDAVEDYYMEDYSDEIVTSKGGKLWFSVQGGFAYDGLLYCAASGDNYSSETDNRVKIIYAWDWKNKRLHSRIPLDKVIYGEIEDADFHNGAIVVKAGYLKNKFYRLYT